MPGRNIPLVNGEVYHLFNRGVNKQRVFLQPRDYKRFQQTFYYYQYLKPKPRFSLLNKSQFASFNPHIDTKLVEVFCYCIMPNHFHFLVKQLKENGISIFMSQLLNSYTKYFNLKYGFIGPAFQGTFKSVIVENEEQFIHLSRYIHLNPVVSGITQNLSQYLWSSLNEYSSGVSSFCNIKEVMSFFPSSEKYVEFIHDQEDYGISLELLKHKIIEEV